MNEFWMDYAKLRDDEWSELFPVEYVPQTNNLA